MGCHALFIPLLPLLLSTIKQHRLHQVTSVLKVCMIYILLCEGAEALEQLAQRCGYPIPEVFQARMDVKHGLVEGVPAHAGELELDDL